MGGEDMFTPDFDKSSWELYDYLSRLATARSKYDELWRLSMEEALEGNDGVALAPRLQSRTPADNFEEVAAARCKATLMYASLAPRVPDIDQFDKYTFNRSGKQSTDLSWTAGMSQIKQPSNMSTLDANIWENKIDAIVQSKLALDRMGNHEAQFRRGRAAFASFVAKMTDPESIGSNKLMVGERVAPFIPARPYIKDLESKWQPSNWITWPGPKRPIGPAFLQSVQHATTLWYLDQPVDEAFIALEPRAHWDNFWEDQQDLAILSHCVFPQQTVLWGTSPERTTDEQPVEVTAIEFAIGLVPILGEVVSLVEVITGYNMFNYKMTDSERAINAVFLFFPALGKIWRPAGQVTEAVSKVTTAIISKVFRKTVQPFFILFGFVKSIALRMRRSWGVLKSTLRLTYRQLEYLAGKELEKVTKWLASSVEKLALMCKVFSEEAVEGLGMYQYAWADVRSPGLPSMAAGANWKDDILNGIKWMSKQLDEKAAQEGITSLGSRSAKEIEQNADRIFKGSLPKWLTEMTEAVLEKDPPLREILTPDVFLRVLEKFPVASHMSGQIMEEALHYEVQLARNIRFTPELLGLPSSFGKTLECIQGHRITDIARRQFTDLILGTFAPPTPELGKQGYAGILNLGVIMEAKVSRDGLQDFKMSKTALKSDGSMNAIGYEFARGQLAFEVWWARTMSKLRPGEPVPAFNPADVEDIAKNFSRAGQAVKDYLRVLRDGSIYVDGKLYKIELPKGGVANVKIFCFLPRGVISDLVIKNTKNFFQSYGLYNVEVGSIVSMDYNTIRKLTVRLYKRAISAAQQKVIQFEGASPEMLKFLEKLIQETE